jgi:isoquinoline 1-oxidoreductase subunit alpha
MSTSFQINGKSAHSEAPPATPLLWVIREELKLAGTKFGCGTGLCGACMVHVDGKRAFSCQTQIGQIAGKAVTTIEGISADATHPVQKAWLAERVPQCGYCQSGQIMSAVDLLKQKPHPTRAEIVEQMSAHIFAAAAATRASCAPSNALRVRAER